MSKEPQTPASEAAAQRVKESGGQRGRQGLDPWGLRAGGGEEGVRTLFPMSCQAAGGLRAESKGARIAAGGPQGGGCRDSAGHGGTWGGGGGAGAWRWGLAGASSAAGGVA